MQFYYPDDYGPYVGTRIEDAGQPGKVRPLWKRRLNRLFMRLGYTNSVPSQSAGRMLEIGCASGAFLHEMASQGWEVEGIEFSEGAAAAARAAGYRVSTGSLETSPAAASTYDLIVGWMVLEHLHDPVAALRKLRASTRPGTWLALSTPNAASYERRLFKDAWLAWHLPNHLYHFTPQTLGKILDKGGWKLERVFHQRQLSNLIASTGYALEDRGKLPAIAERLIRFPMQSGKINYAVLPMAYLMSLVGQTGRMTIWARQKDD
jgi:2-polyprenyl-3-methyl-5-hydroxy-6-metoxy-1,4-benzoquinol methylase